MVKASPALETLCQRQPHSSQIHKVQYETESVDLKKKKNKTVIYFDIGHVVLLQIGQSHKGVFVMKSSMEEVLSIIMSTQRDCQHKPQRCTFTLCGFRNGKQLKWLCNRFRTPNREQQL